MLLLVTVGCILSSRSILYFSSGETSSASVIEEEENPQQSSMIPAAVTHRSNMETQDLFSKLGGHNGDGLDSQDGADDGAMFGAGVDDLMMGPLNDSGGPDFFEKFMQDSITKRGNSFSSGSGMISNPSLIGASGSTNMFMHGGNESDMNAQSLFESALSRSNDFFADGDSGGPVHMMETNNFFDAGSSTGMQNQTFNLAPSSGLNDIGGASLLTQPVSGNQRPSQNWFLEDIVESPAIRKGLVTTSANYLPSLPSAGNTALDASPLNISLELSLRGGMSTMRRKGSNVQLNSSSKSNLVVKASKTSNIVKSSKSEGLLARALKAKYNSSSQLCAYSVNAEQAAAVIAKSQGSMSNMLSSSRTGSSMLRNTPSMNAMGQGSSGLSGTLNASWRSTPDRASSSSMIQQMLLSKNRSSTQLPSTQLPSNDSTSALFKAKLNLGSSSKSSMQDLLRLSRSQSKTQSMLRQSSAHSLMKQTSSQSLKDASTKVDVSSLLPPDHANSRKSSLSARNLLGGGSGMNGSSSRSNATFPLAGSNERYGDNSMQDGIQTESLLHQSCRLYPTTDAVVESALRIDPDAIRRAVPTTVDHGSLKKANNVYGYPINVALTYGASMGVLKMLVLAGPDVLIQKDGTDGSGSLGIALSLKCDIAVVSLLIEANPQCVRVADRRGNYPLHVAVSCGLPLPIVKLLFAMYPKAQEMRNFHSQTPLDIAQRSTRCPEEVMNFLQSAAYSNLESTVHHIDNNPGSLEDGLDDIMRTNY